MKLYAYAREEGGDRLIHVWEAERMRQAYPDKARMFRYYSTELDASQRREVVLVRRENRLFFRYKELPDPPPNTSAQTLTHLKAKEIISRMKQLRFVLPDREFLLWIENWETEKRIELPGGEVAIADLSGRVLASQPPEAVALWQGRLLIEITVTHPSTPERLNALAAQGWPVLEVPIGPRLRIPEGLNVSEQQIQQAESVMEHCFRQGIRARLVAEPGTALKKEEGIWRSVLRFLDDIITN